MRYLITIIILITIPVQAFCQYEEYLQEDPEPTIEKQAGVAISVVESGTGIGGFYYMPLKGFMYLGATLNVFFLRDPDQFEVYDYYGYPYTYNKKNNVYLIDLLLTLKKRLFVRDFADNFRPFIAVSIGPIYGMNFPEDKSLKDQYEWAFSGAAAAGVDVVVDNSYIFSLRLQYRFMKFGEKLGPQKDHSMFDLRLELGKRF